MGARNFVGEIAAPQKKIQNLPFQDEPPRGARVDERVASRRRFVESRVGLLVDPSDVQIPPHRSEW